LQKHDQLELISRDEVLEYLKKSCTGKENNMKEPQDSAVLAEQELILTIAEHEPTNKNLDSLDLEAMFEQDENEVMGPVDTEVTTESDSEESIQKIPTTIPKKKGNPITTQESIAIVQENNNGKRKECECNHDDYFGQAYSDIETKAYFQPNYMSEREHPVHYCTGIKDDGKKCGYDFTRSDLVINKSYPVRACKQAMKIDTECVHALCYECFTTSRAELTKTNAGQRPTRRRRCSLLHENGANLAFL
jgi:hypothetical protein